MKLIVTILLMLFYVNLFAEDMTYWRVGDNGQLIQITEKERDWENTKDDIKNYYIPLTLGIVGIVSLAPVGLLLGFYILIHTSPVGVDYSKKDLSQ